MRPIVARERVARIVAGLFGLVIAAALVVGVGSERGLEWDFVSYYNGGSRLYHGEARNLYRPDAPIAGRPAFFSPVFDYVGFPLSAWVFAPLGAFSPVPALRVFKLFCAACAAGGLLLLYREVLCASDRRWRSATGLALFLGAVAAFGPLWLIFGVGGQLTATAFLLLVLSFVALRRERLGASALCFSGVILLKPFFLASAWVFALARDWPWLGRLAIALGVEAALSLALFGLQVHFDWFDLLRQKEGWWAAPWWNDVAPIALAGDFWYYAAGQALPLEAPPPPLLHTLQWVFKLAALALFARLASETRRSALPAERRREHAFALAALLPLFLPTMAWPHYLVLFLVPLSIVAARSAARSRGAALLAAALLISALRPDLWLIFARGPRLRPVESLLEAIGLSLYGRATLLMALGALLVRHARLLRIQELSTRNATDGAPSGQAVGVRSDA